MADPFLGEIRLFANTFVPNGWFPCNGQVLPISSYTALFSLLGINFGGNGQTNFCLPNLNGFAAIGAGQSVTGTLYDVGETLGANSVTLSINEIPHHTHQLVKKNTTGGGVNAKIPVANPNCDLGGLSAADGSVGYMSGNNSGAAPNTSFDPRTITISGGSQAHENRQPFLSVYFGIAWQGIYPARP
jgi:microcystin-dependent protein